MAPGWLIALLARRAAGWGVNEALKRAFKKKEKEKAKEREKAKDNEENN